MTTKVVAATTQAIEAAARCLAAGDLVAFPTETVYGLGADARNDRAVASVFDAKGRPRFNPLIVHTRDSDAARHLVRFNAVADQLATAFWPGGLTLVLPRLPDCSVSWLASAGLDTIAVRVPSHPTAIALLDAFGGPLAAPSANPSGAISPTAARHVADSLPHGPAVILDGGSCSVGLESTVIDVSVSPPRLLRPGAIPREDIEAIVGPVTVGPVAVGPKDGGAPRSPGLLARHYAPDLPMRLSANGARPGEILLAFGPGAPPKALNLSSTGDLQEAAGNLFAMLRQLDRPENGTIAVMPVPENGLGLAINDRLKRAALQSEDGDSIRQFAISYTAG